MNAVATINGDRISFDCPSCHQQYSWSTALPSVQDCVIRVDCDACGQAISVTNPAAQMDSRRAASEAESPQAIRPAAIPTGTRSADSTPVIGVIMGAMAGIPVSYFLQSGAFRAKVSLSEYLLNLPQLLGQYPGNLGPPIAVSCAICAAVGWFVASRVKSRE